MCAFQLARTLKSTCPKLRHIQFGVRIVSEKEKARPKLGLVISKKRVFSKGCHVYYARYLGSDIVEKYAAERQVRKR